jgi:hypothetical protein
MSDDYTHENAAERERLFRLTAGLSEADLAQPLPKGWSVATKLLHLAFWDQYCLALLARWKSTVPSTSSMDVDAVNEAVRVLSTAVPASAVIPLVRTAAEAVDREVEGITPGLREAIEKAGRERVIRRFLHRRAHLDQIEMVLREAK